MKTRDQNKLAIYRCGVTIKFSKNRNIKKISASYMLAEDDDNQLSSSCQGVFYKYFGLFHIFSHPEPVEWA